MDAVRTLGSTAEAGEETTPEWKEDPLEGPPGSGRCSGGAIQGTADADVAGE